MSSKETRVNETIRAASLRVIDENDRQLGVISRAEALRAAQDAGLDLVEVSPNADPPVARIIDWGKYRYQKDKQAQKSRSKAKTLDVKQMRFGMKISQHDMDVKLRKVNQFLDAGHKVRISVVYKGRELAHRELGYQHAERITAALGEGIVVDQKPEFAGRMLSFMIRKVAKNHAKTEDAQRSQETRQDN